VGHAHNLPRAPSPSNPSRHETTCKRLGNHQPIAARQDSRGPPYPAAPCPGERILGLATRNTTPKGLRVPAIAAASRTISIAFPDSFYQKVRAQFPMAIGRSPDMMMQSCYLIAAAAVPVLAGMRARASSITQSEPPRHSVHFRPRLWHLR
jgi:hypothetical protein